MKGGPLSLFLENRGRVVGRTDSLINYKDARMKRNLGRGMSCLDAVERGKGKRINKDIIRQQQQPRSCPGGCLESGSRPRLAGRA